MGKKKISVNQLGERETDEWNQSPTKTNIS